MKLTFIFIFFLLLACTCLAQNKNDAKLSDHRYLKKPGFDTIYLNNLDTTNKLVICENNDSKIFAYKNDILSSIKMLLKASIPGYQSRCDSILMDTLSNRMQHRKNIHVFFELEKIPAYSDYNRQQLALLLMNMIINNKVLILNKNSHTLASMIYYRRTEGGNCCCNHTFSFDTDGKKTILKFGCSDVIILCD